MNFTYQGADLSKVIKTFERSENNFHIEYMDGSTANFCCDSEKEADKIRKEMVEQAIDRQNNMNMSSIEKAKIFNQLFTILASINTVVLFNFKKEIIALLVLIVGALFEVKTTNKRETLKELKKYKLFLEMIDDIDYINSGKFLNCVEPDSLFQIPLGIDTLDRYSYGDIKIINRTLMKEKKMNQKTIG